MAEGDALSRRLRSKTQWPPQASLPAPLLLDDEATTDPKRQAYLITFPFPRQARAASGHALVASSSLPKATLISKVLDAFAQITLTRGRSMRQFQCCVLACGARCTRQTGAPHGKSMTTCPPWRQLGTATCPSSVRSCGGTAWPAIGLARTRAIGAASGTALWRHRRSPTRASTTAQSCGT